MSTAGIVLILAILMLGGVIATVGDRLGTKVGKAKLSLFKLRPRQTAVLVTILTGFTVSATTLGILFAASDQLRKGIFELDKIQQNLRRSRQDLDEVRQQKTAVEKELSDARSQQATAQQRLNATNQSLNTALTKLSEAAAKQSRTEAALQETQKKFNQISGRYQQAQHQLKVVARQTQTLRSEITQLQRERQTLTAQRDHVKTQIAQRDKDIAQLDRTIAQRDLALTQRASRLKELEKQQAFLEDRITTLSKNFQSLSQDFRQLRLGNVAILRGQVLWQDVVRIVDPKATRLAVDQLLQRANQQALRQVQPGASRSNERVIGITTPEVEQLIQQIADGRTYVIRILSAGNYLVGEKSVRVFADTALNQLIFRSGEQLATISVDPSAMAERELLQRLEQLLVASQFRARRGGMLLDSIELESDALAKFFEQLKAQKQPLDIRAIASTETYTSGPLQLELVAVQNGQVLFRSRPPVQ
jgi:uncharacterized protein (DUF3084 family)